MKLISQKRALELLAKRKANYKRRIAAFEHRAKDCITCETPGACCLDAHFVNVRISRLEAAAITDTLNKLTPHHRPEVYRRIEQTVEKYALTADGYETYACPLFEKGTGCLVHLAGKPVPCITHACYEDKADLPPNELQIAEEESIEHLNQQVYGHYRPWLSLPLALLKYRESVRSPQPAAEDRHREQK